MIKDRATELGLPQDDKMPNGLSTGFLQGIIDNKPGWRLQMLR